MSEEKSREELYKQIFIYGGWGLISVLFIIIGGLLEHDHALLSHIATEVGIAVLVAIILALTIEHQSKKREERRLEAERKRGKRRLEAERKKEEERLVAEREAIKKDVFEHVLGHRLPEGTFAEMDNQILNSSFIRRDFTASYTLSALGVGEGAKKTKFMKLEAKYSYRIVNQMREKKPYIFMTVIEQAPVEELNEYVKFTSVNVKGCEEPITLDTKEKIDNAVDRNKRPNHLTIEKGISIPPNESAWVNIKFQAVRAFEGGVSYLLHPLQTMVFNLKVEAPEDVAVSATAYLPEELAEGEEHVPNSNSYHWKLMRPILPYQGVYLTWKSKAAAVAQQPADEVAGQNSTAGRK
jgi:hypothetical protein